MVDVHKQGTKLRITGTTEGEFGVENLLKSYESSLTDIPDALNYQGINIYALL